MRSEEQWMLEIKEKEPLQIIDRMNMPLMELITLKEVTLKNANKLIEIIFT